MRLARLLRRLPGALTVLLRWTGCLAVDPCTPLKPLSGFSTRAVMVSRRYGCFIDSCTQEEILQMCCPEFNLCMLHFGVMADAEVVVVHNVKRFSSYTGYLRSFRFAGPFAEADRLETVLALDAVSSSHFHRSAIVRDICKAYLGFRGFSSVSTGRWGCGIFGGLPSHKFAQQLVAASLAGCQLRFSTFGAPEGCDELLAAYNASEPSAAHLFEMLLDCSSLGRHGFLDAFCDVLRNSCGGP